MQRPPQFRDRAPRPRALAGILALAAATLAPEAGAYTPGGAVTRPDTPPDLGLDVRVGALIPAQLLDGPGLHLSLGGRYRLAGPLWIHLEAGVDRVAVSALSDDVPLPGGTVEVSTTYARWSAPALLGLGLHWDLGDGDAIGFAVEGGGAWQYGRQDVTVRGDVGQRVRRDTWMEPLIQARVQGGIGLEIGALTLAVGWRGAPAAPDEATTRGVGADGLLLEAGWSTDF